MFCRFCERGSFSEASFTANLRYRFVYHLHAIVAICDGQCFKYDNVDGCYDMDDDQRTDNDE